MMTTLVRLAARRRSAALAVLMTACALALVLALPPDSEALGCGYGWVVYSDSSMSQIIGARFWYPEACNCEYVAWGSFTGYRVYQSFSCW
jgi:hypothetical protein